MTYEEVRAGPPAARRSAPSDAAVLDWLFADSPVALSVYDTSLRCTRQNPAMARLAGAPDERDAWFGRRVTEILPGPQTAAWEARMRQVLDSGEPAPATGIRTVGSAAGTERSLSITAHPLRGPDGAVTGLCLTAEDVTEPNGSADRLLLLNEAGTRIGSTLDVRRTAEELAEELVPLLGEWVNIDLLDTLLKGEEPGPFTGQVALRRVANHSVRPGAPEALLQPGEVDFYPPHSPAVRSMAGGRSVTHLFSEPAAQAWLRDQPARAASVRGYGYRSILCVPVRARGTVLGVTVLIRSREQPFTDEDRLLAEELVARAAVCLDNARRFTRERTAVLTLQQSLLPSRLPSLMAVEAVSRYLPAHGVGGAGGDWFDVIPLSGARVALVVGDVVGRGLGAAATMGRLRTAVRTLADVDLPPDELLTRLDDLVDQSAAAGDDTSMDAADLGATCLYAVFDPVSGSCVAARAGHPAPVVVTPDGEAGELPLPAGPPLGLGNAVYEAAEVRLPEGSLLTLYTDGLLDPSDAELSLRRLCSALSHPAAPLETVCDHVLDTVLPQDRADDVALIVARTRTFGADKEATLDVPDDPAAVATARAWAADRLAGWGLEELGFVTELVVSELVTNALLYGEPPVRLRLLNVATLICEVTDGSNTAPHLRRARLSDEGGRGLMLVAALTQRWGTRHTRRGKTIWCEQGLPRETAAHVR
ncbi:SpoIIE family protein phosphatase [Streptomyces heilongjiangensis]|uniref:SpoIIE family protein phosphatase n=1 Tax=Streptomyces heilongjiangensis TaxID=945052 RepID=A0ABW1BAG7_9ACTN|nr:SpoIIE family protein phosphatase [Streptomyces heilongjiangensis]MDC2951164.1 SpoIIE family protein phosphatase [Streptomyces heilongjiangensis]